MKNISKLQVLAAVAFCSAFSAVAAEDHIEKTFAVGSGGKLVMEVNVGSIEVKAGDAKDVHIDVFRTAKARAGLLGGGNAEEREKEELAANEISFEQKGQEVFVKAERKKDGDAWRNRVNLNVRYVVAVPKQFGANVKTAGGGISVTDLKGDLVAKTSGGSLKFTGVQGPIDGHTSGGGIHLAQCNGETKIKTSGGGIDIEKHTGNIVAHTSGGSIKVDDVKGNIQASTSGGSVHAQLASAPTADCRLETSGGSITVSLPEISGVDLDAKTSGGSVKSDLPLTTVEHKSHSALKGKINKGGSALQLRTSGGSVYVKKA
jgi:hypothetical protein